MSFMFKAAVGLGFSAAFATLAVGAYELSVNDMLRG